VCSGLGFRENPLIYLGILSNCRRTVNRRAFDAGFLNFFIWGSGYLYLGKRSFFVILLTVGRILLWIESYWGTYLQLPTGPTDFYAFTWVVSIVLGFAFGYDAYQMGVQAPPLHAGLPAAN